MKKEIRNKKNKRVEVGDSLFRTARNECCVVSRLGFEVCLKG